MIDEGEARAKAARYDELLRAYGQVVLERDEAVREVAALRQTIQSYEARNHKQRTKLSSRGFGPPRDGDSRPDSAGSSGFTRG